ncbi:BTB/POZ domain-containing protein 19 isoform X3 [Apodemus sylvaticus]|uniref:BTB/POZ domain-containing protein 19 isoform X3 n=1 Tax=Apodemus sylvaticus TaxID=10129 RepID=UPI002244802A|nr:BTB/POZ domain-containing protein 19 isoform X3 [Apodemus sylvaticus]
MENTGLVVHGQAAPFSTALRSLVNNPQYSDVCFVVGQERQEVFAHRCLLACRCNFFQRLLGPGVPSPVVLSTVPAEAFLAVLEFLYTNRVKLHRYSVLEVLTAAVEYGLEELQEEALRTRGFLELSATALLPVLRSDKLSVDEAELVQAARTWARVGAAVLEQPVAELAAPVVRELRLALLSPAELSALEEQNRQEPLIPVRTPVTKHRSTLPHGDEDQGLKARDFGLRGDLLSLYRLNRLWRHGNATPYREEMRPGAHRVAGGGAPCHGITIAFWTFISNDPLPDLSRRLTTSQTTAPEVLCAGGGLPLPASSAAGYGKDRSASGVKSPGRSRNCAMGLDCWVGCCLDTGKEGGLCCLSSRGIPQVRHSSAPPTRMTLYLISSSTLTSQLPGSRCSADSSFSPSFPALEIVFLFSAYLEPGPQFWFFGFFICFLFFQTWFLCVALAVLCNSL